MMAGQMSTQMLGLLKDANCLVPDEQRVSLKTLLEGIVDQLPSISQF